MRSARERSVVALSSLRGPLRGAIPRFMCARAYQVLLGLATEGLPPEAKASPLLSPMASSTVEPGSASEVEMLAVDAGVLSANNRRVMAVTEAMREEASRLLGDPRVSARANEDAYLGEEMSWIAEHFDAGRSGPSWEDVFASPPGAMDGQQMVPLTAERIEARPARCRTHQPALWLPQAGDCHARSHPRRLRGVLRR
jgi:hypothetical protein